MSSKRVALLLAVLFCFAALAPTALFAQSASTGSVAGTVTDAQGAAVAGATVTLTDKATGIPRTAGTNEAGRYIFVDVNPGTYNVSVNKTGFRVSKVVDQVVQVGLALTLNVTLEVGSVAETVEVSASTGAEMQTLNATVGNTIGGDTLQNLPTIQRDAATFVTLQPGVSPDGSVAGAVVDQSSFMLDGGQNTNDMDGSMQVYTPSFAGDPTGGIVSNAIGGSPTGVMPTPIDSVEEYKVNTANQTADFNSSAGAEVQVVTKRGTNAWHGSAYEYYLDNHFNANTWDNNQSGTALPSFHYNRFGASGGGPIINKQLLGGKTYFFANYEGFRWNNSATGTWIVPSASLRNGIITNPADGTQYNLKTGANCGAGTAACDPRGIGINSLVQQMWTQHMPLSNAPASTPCLSFAGSSRCDGVNEQAFRANYSLPLKSNFGVARIDHDFGAKWHFNAAYRMYTLRKATTNQTDIGGSFSGDTLGQPVSLANRPQQPWYLVAGVTTNITSNTTNDFHFSYLRNYWSWSDPGGIPQFANVGTDVGGAALEPFGESTTVLAPYNVNTQSVRTRFWDGQDKFFRDDLSILKGNHYLTFGGAYQRNWDWHQRSDNGGGINYQATYQLGDSIGGGLVDFSSTLPSTYPSSTQWARLNAAVLGIVTDSQIAYTRSGSQLNLNPPLTHAFDQSTIPYYNVYFSDSWHLKPTFTLTYGLGWTLEMPPTEAAGKQIELVDDTGAALDEQTYIKQREVAALNGQVYNPTVGFALVGNTGAGQKYPYDPYYGSFSPRVAAAWNPNYADGILGKVFGGSKSVIRGGYSRVYGRLNGVDLVLVPLLGTGLIQAVQCRNNNMDGTCTVPAGGLSVANAFRIGTDGNNAPIPAATATLPQPTFPGINNVSAAAGESLDPHFRPNVVDSFDLTIQRQITPKVLVEFGYIGRRITHEYQPVNINAVPYMMTVGGQSFAKAYAAIETALGCATSYNACGAAVPKPLLPDGVTANPAYAAFFNSIASQPFFQSSLASTGYCNGNFPGIGGVAFASCTAALARKQLTNFEGQNVWSLWSALDKGGIGGGPICATATCTNANGTVVNQGQQTTAPGFDFARTMMNSPINTSAFGGNGQLSSGVGVNASIGHGNYNGGFASVRVNNWHNITLQENFTYSKALGTGAFVQATSEYTPNDPFNINNMYGVQNFDRKFVFNTYALIDDPWYKGQQGIIGRLLGGWSVAPIFAAGSGAPVYCGSNSNAQSFGAGDGANFFDNEQCIFTGAHPYGSSKVPNTADGGFNAFSNPAALYSTVRNPILGLDTGTGGVGEIRGLMYWNMDMRVVKNIKVRERMGLQFEYTLTNVFNHPVFFDPNLDPTSFDSSDPAGSWGAITSQGNNPRAMQFGLRFTF